MNPDATISLCMIVRDEEEILAKCLEHVKPFVDEFIIVDTGSVDKTRDIIAKYGVVHEIPFENFVKTKNDALALASGDYILWMDADEILYQGGEILREHANEGKFNAIYCPITEGGADYSASSNVYDRARLWKRGTHSFVGPGVHEVAVGYGDTLRDKRILVRHEHLKKDKAATAHVRFEKYTELLTDAIATGNEVSRALFYLARTYRDMGMPLEAVSAYIQYLGSGTQYLDEIWQAHYDIAICYKGMGEYAHAQAWAEKAVGVDSTRSEADCLLGDLAFQQQRYREASVYYNRAIHSIPQHVTLFILPDTYWKYPKDQLVLCHYFLNEYDEALEIANELIKHTLGRDERLCSNAFFCRQKICSTVFFCLGHTPEPVYGGMIQQQGTGGVETTYLELTEELARGGMNVFLFCHTERAHVYRGVYYVPFGEIKEYANHAPDVIIASRWFEPFKMFFNAKKIIWFQDAFFGIPDDIPDLFDIADNVICSSEWHKNYIHERLGRSLLAAKLSIIPLGIRKELFIEPIDRCKNSVIYSSNPDRGLEQLIDMWDEITIQNPSITLTVTYGWDGLKTWSADQAWHGNISRLQEKCHAKALERGNIRFTGRLAKHELAKEMLSSSLLVYPNNFWETFCLTALESQAAGLPIITSDMGALSTVVSRDSNVLIPGSPMNKSYQDMFISNVTRLLHDDVTLGQMSKANQAYIQKSACDWTDVGKPWRTLIYSML